MEQKIQDLENQIEELNEIQKLLEEDNESQKNEITKLKVSIQNKDSIIDSLRSQSNIKNDNDSSQEFLKLNEKIKTLEQKLEDKNLEIEILKDENKNLYETKQHSNDINTLYQIEQTNINNNLEIVKQNEIQNLEEQQLIQQNNIYQLEQIEDKKSDSNNNNEELDQMKQMINQLELENESQKQQLKDFTIIIQTVKEQLTLENNLKTQLTLELEQYKLDLKENQSKNESYEDELIKYQQKYEILFKNKEQISQEYQKNQQELNQLHEIQSDNAQLQLLLEQKTEELNQLKNENIYEKKYLEINEEYEGFKEYAQLQLNKKDEDIQLAASYLQDYETCKESLELMEQQHKLLQEQLNKINESNQQLQDQNEQYLIKIKEGNESINKVKELQLQNTVLKNELEQIKQQSILDQEQISELEAQLMNLKQIECESPIKLKKLQSEYAENKIEYLQFKDQAERDLHICKQEKQSLQQEINDFQNMLNAYIDQQGYQSNIQNVQEYYEKLIDFSDDLIKMLEKKEQQFQSYQKELQSQYQKETIEKQTQTLQQTHHRETQSQNKLYLEESTQTEVIENSLSGSMWLNQDEQSSQLDQLQNLKKKNEDLDQLLKNYEKEVSNLKQQNKMLSKKIDSNIKPNVQDRLGKRMSLFEDTPKNKKSKFYQQNLYESQIIEEKQTQKDINFTSEIVKQLKKEKQELQNIIENIQQELKVNQEKHQEEYSKLEEQLNSQIILNQTRSKSIEQNYINTSTFTNTMIQLNQIELFLVVKPQKNLSFPYLEFNRKQIKFFSQVKSRIEKTTFETFLFDDIFFDIQKIRQYFQFYGKASIDQSRMILFIGQSKTQKKMLMIMFLDLYYQIIKEQKIRNNVRIQIQYQEKIGNTWNNLSQLTTEIIFQQGNIQQSYQQLELIIQNIKFYLFGKNQLINQVGKEKVRLLTINYSININSQYYTQQLILATIPIVPRCDFQKFLKKMCNHQVSQNIKYYCFLTINPQLLHFHSTVDIMYMAKIIYAQNNSEELNQHMKIDDESIRQVRQATGQVAIKNQEIDILKKQQDCMKKQFIEFQTKEQEKFRLNQQINNLIQNIIVDLKIKLSNTQTKDSFIEKLIQQLENINRKLTPLQQSLNTDRSWSPKIY